MESYQKYIISKNSIAKSDMSDFCDANFSNALETLHLGMHWFKLMPHHRSSDPHAESHEEEFVFVVSGRPQAWINGYIYELELGPHNGLAHSSVEI